MTTLDRVARDVVNRLARHNKRLVLAESCTAGLVAATLARVPGVSDYLCGSAVTYRNETKAAWLKISRAKLREPGPVSAVVARQMSSRVLALTSEAGIAAAVTGHLGPQAPPPLDGVIYIGLSIRTGRKIVTSVNRQRLTARSRTARQREAARRVLATVRAALGA